jgi:hypothetical protein
MIVETNRLNGPSDSVPQRSTTEHAPSRGRGRRRWPLILGSIVVLLALVHWGGGAIAKWVINGKLAAMDAYTAHVGGVKLALWRGGATVEDFVLRERDKPDEPPLVRVRRASLSAAFRPLLRGKLGGEGLVEDVDVLFAKHHAFAGPKDAAEKAGAEVQEKKEQAKRWQDVLQQTLPMELERFEVRNARFRYIDRAHQPNVDVAIRDLRLVVTGLQNRPKSSDGELPTRVEMSGLTTGDGKLKVTVMADRMVQQPRFTVAFELRELSLPEFNTFMRAYASADVSRGTFEVYSETKAADGAYNGYVKPFFRDLDFKNVADPDKRFTERAKEKVVSAVTSLLKNKEEQKVATVIPFSGNFEAGQVDLWETVHNLLRNAFVQALREGLETQKPSS